jgi:hypothetical protein
MKIENIFELESELMKIFSEDIKVSILKDILLIGFVINKFRSEKAFRINFKNNKFIIYFEKDYSDEKYKNIYLIIINFFRRERIKFEIKKHERKIFNILNLFKKREDLDVIDIHGDPRCPDTEEGFYFILRKEDRNYNYQSGPLIYFNSKLVGVLKFEGSVHLLSFNDNVLKKNMFFNLPIEFENEIEKNFNKTRVDYWFRVNFVGDKFPINLNSSVHTKLLYDFSNLKYCRRFPEIYKKSDDEIFKQFEFWIDECVRENDINIRMKDFDYVREV